MPKELIINRAWCKGCGICEAFCPKKALVIRHDKVELASPEACIKCGMCEQRCPDYAIFVREAAQ
ncbi:MAG: 4Fe-4S binding protein [Clostridiales bacterium]|jgi:2-oxoglutarate ferredoxin oxidoreductase subunit delta|nr:4Fe-4S binding protein [Clostridiales bacterium]